MDLQYSGYYLTNCPDADRYLASGETQIGFAFDSRDAMKSFKSSDSGVSRTTFDDSRYSSILPIRYMVAAISKRSP